MILNVSPQDIVSGHGQGHVRTQHCTLFPIPYNKLRSPFEKVTLNFGMNFKVILKVSIE